MNKNCPKCKKKLMYDRPLELKKKKSEGRLFCSNCCKWFEVEKE
jgi:uncharacterized protein YbaR (Trm112 family)